MKSFYLLVLLILTPLLIMEYNIDTHNTYNIPISKEYKSKFNNDHLIVHKKFKKYNNPNYLH